MHRENFSNVRVLDDNDDGVGNAVDDDDGDDGDDDGNGDMVLMVMVLTSQQPGQQGALRALSEWRRRR